MASATNLKLFTIERRLGGVDDNGAVAGPRPAAADDSALVEIRELLRALDARVGALPQIEEIEARLVTDMVDIQGRIKTTKEEIAALRHPKANDDKLARASLQLDAIVEQTEQATSTILEATEKLEEGISHIRDTHSNDPLIANTADQMVDAITAIYEASNFQDITGQRIRKVVDVLKYIEDRLGRMVSLWGAGEIGAMPLPEDDIDMRDDDVALTGPKLDTATAGTPAISQDDIDAMFD